MSAHPAGPKHADAPAQDTAFAKPATASEMTTLPEHVYPRHAARGEDGVDFCAFDSPGRYLVGYGMDDAGRYRGLPYIGALD